MFERRFFNGHLLSMIVRVRDIACANAIYWHCICSYVRNDRFRSSDTDVTLTAKLTAYANYLLVLYSSVITTKREDCEMQLQGLRAMCPIEMLICDQ